MPQDVVEPRDSASEQTADSDSGGKSWLAPSLGLMIPCLALLEIYLFFTFTSVDFTKKISLLLSVIGIYGIATGLLQLSERVKNFYRFDDMTSPYPLDFVRSNLHFLTVLFLSMYFGLSPESRQRGSPSLRILGTLILLTSVVPLLLYAIVHLFIICPLAYISYVISGSVVETIAGSSAPLEIKKIKGDSSVSDILNLQKAISQNMGAARGFLVGIPYTIFFFALEVRGIFL